MIIKLYSNRKVEPSSIIMANQHENMTRVLEFNLEQVPNGYRYLVLTNSSGSNLYLITDNKVDITSAFTWNGQTYEANVVVSNIELENELVSTNVLWISNTFRLQVRRNNINAEELSKLPIPPDLQMPYDKLLQLIEDVEGKLENGEFNGKDGVGIKSIEKTGSEGLVDTYTITLTNDSTFVYSVTNGRNGIDGKSAYELAVENGFEGSVDEWLASLDYEHSEEFEQLAEQVKNDAKKSASNASTASAAAQSAATNAGAALNSANAASQSAADASVSATQAQQAAQEAENSKTSAETASSNAQQSAQSAEENANKAQEIADSLDPTIFAIKETTQGNTTIISDSAEWMLQKLNVYGQSEQDSTTGKNLLSYPYISGDKTQHGVTFTVNSDGSISVSGTATREVYFNLINMDLGEEPFGITPSKEQQAKNGYILSANCKETKMYVSYSANDNLIYAYVTTGTIVDGVLRVQIEKGDIATPWEKYTGGKPSPSPDYPQEIISKEVSEIKVTGANLLNPTGAFKQDWNIVLPNVKFEVGNTYTFTPPKMAVGEKCGLFAVASNTELVSYINNGVTRSFTVEENADFSQGVILAGGSETAMVDVDEKTAMVELGSVATEFEPYKSQTITLSDPITLRGNQVTSGGNVTIDGQQYVSDVITEKDGVVGVERNCEETILDGVNNIVTYVSKPDWTELVNCSLWNIRLEKNHYYGGLRKNALLTISSMNLYNNEDYEHFYITDRLDNYMTLFILDSRLETVDTTNANEWLKQNKPKLLYLLATPTFEPLPEEIQAQYKALKSYYPNTVIQTGCWNEVEYVADTKTWIENKINGVTELALGIGGK